VTEIAAFDAEECADIGVFLESLTPQQWEAPSLCDQWRVRDVVGHLLVAYEISPARMLSQVARTGFSPDAAIARLAVARASDASSSELIAAWKSSRRRRDRLAGVAPPRGFFYDHFVHHQDMRRPLGATRTVPSMRLLALLDCAPRHNGFRSRQRVRGLRLIATDVDWSHGDGPEVAGTAEALLVALAGRPAPLSELHGDGVAMLASRVGSSASRRRGDAQP
jgi:uncharacterized protein (TIGR03083 family)